ncbi:ribbon-helix-helix domain-containing protein [Planobispora longispora]|uniref:ribbon-helix-helix domain-containing protein n=1 Tax=Planobispora longispora TaxID=28887 RepID=UPI0019457C05|nr:hypothetical protein [Planobispora longispora]
MNVGITLSPQDAFFIEDYISYSGSPSRSAVIREAIRLLRDREVEKEYAVAFTEAEEDAGEPS